MNNEFVYCLENWYVSLGRDLPWRHTADPWLVLMSEVILQQTRVAQGLAYYERFCQVFPTPEAMASAEEDLVLLHWKGLGYYSRARNLHRASRQIVDMGGFPETYSQVLKLSGVGEYTAAAVCSFCYGQPYAVLDGNVFRVLSRYFGIDLPMDTTAGKRLFREMADEMLDVERPALYNQAIMDFGAVVCTPKSPSCMDCPLCQSCSAYNHGTVSLLPVKSRSVRVRNRFLTYFFLFDESGNVYLKRRGEGDIWQGLYEPYCVETDKPMDELEAIQIFPHAEAVKISTGHTHQLSHQHLYVDSYRVKFFSARPSLPGMWIPLASLQDYAVPRLIDRLMGILFTRQDDL